MTVRELINDLLLECEANSAMLDADIVYLNDKTNTWTALEFAPLPGSIASNGDLSYGETVPPVDLATGAKERLCMVLS